MKSVMPYHLSSDLSSDHLFASIYPGRVVWTFLVPLNVYNVYDKGWGRGNWPSRGSITRTKVKIIEGRGRRTKVGFDT